LPTEFSFSDLISQNSTRDREREREGDGGDKGTSRVFIEGKDESFAPCKLFLGLSAFYSCTFASYYYYYYLLLFEGSEYSFNLPSVPELGD
jgi:hypothetical protein